MQTHQFGSSHPTIAHPNLANIVAVKVSGYHPYLAAQRALEGKRWHSRLSDWHILQLHPVIRWRCSTEVWQLWSSSYHYQGNNKPQMHEPASPINSPHSSQQNLVKAARIPQIVPCGLQPLVTRRQHCELSVNPTPATCPHGGDTLRPKQHSHRGYIHLLRTFSMVRVTPSYQDSRSPSNTGKENKKLHYTTIYWKTKGRPLIINLLNSKKQKST